MRRRMKSVCLAAVLGLVTAGLLSFQAPPAAADTYSDPGFANETVATVAPFTLVGMAFARTAACSCGRRTASSA